MCDSMAQVVIAELLWDEWNTTHIARHDVIPEEVEEVCRGDAHAEQSREGRIRVVASTQAGRMLSVVLAPKGEGKYYPITARPASRKERRTYVQWKGGEQAA